MIHDCKYAREIGAEPKWLTPVEGGKLVCSLCHTPKNTRTIEVPVEEEPPVKAAPKTAGK